MITFTVLPANGSAGCAGATPSSTNAARAKVRRRACAIVALVTGRTVAGSLELRLIRPGRIGDRLQAEGRGARDAERHALAPRRMDAVLGRLADELRAEGIGDD